jgi:hypothetical protein
MNKRTEQKVRDLARQYGARVYFFKNDRPYTGCVNLETQAISIDGNVKKENEIFSALFHEIGHLYCIRNNKWPSYHNNNCTNNDEVRKFRLTAYRAESWVDTWAKKEMRKLMPHLEYIEAYPKGDKKAINWVHKYYLCYFKLK